MRCSPITFFNRKRHLIQRTGKNMAKKNQDAVVLKTEITDINLKTMLEKYSQLMKNLSKRESKTFVIAQCPDFAIMNYGTNSAILRKDISEEEFIESLYKMLD